MEWLAMLLKDHPLLLGCAIGGAAFGSLLLRRGRAGGRGHPPRIAEAPADDDPDVEMLLASDDLLGEKCELRPGPQRSDWVDALEFIERSFPVEAAADPVMRAFCSTTIQPPLPSEGARTVEPTIRLPDYVRHLFSTGATIHSDPFSTPGADEDPVMALDVEMIRRLRACCLSGRLGARIYVRTTRAKRNPQTLRREHPENANAYGHSTVSLPPEIASAFSTPVAQWVSDGVAARRRREAEEARRSGGISGHVEGRDDGPSRQGADPCPLWDDPPLLEHSMPPLMESFCDIDIACDFSSWAPYPSMDRTGTPCHAIFDRFTEALLAWPGEEPRATSWNDIHKILPTLLEEADIRDASEADGRNGPGASSI